jgi:peptide/nickel transport system ATP-binding protein
LILDEPTTALDVVVERDLLRQILQLQAELKFAVIFIGHDIGRLMQLADRMAVLYAGRLAEIAPARDFAAHAAHPYARQLLASMPALHGDPRALRSIPGSPASLRAPPSGCRFHPRCERALPQCSVDEPLLVRLPSGAQLACHNPHEDDATTPAHVLPLKA